MLTAGKTSVVRWFVESRGIAFASFHCVELYSPRLMFQSILSQAIDLATNISWVPPTSVLLLSLLPEHGISVLKILSSENQQGSKPGSNNRYLFIDLFHLKRTPSEILLKTFASSSSLNFRIS
jgi:hypothetical protein